MKKSYNLGIATAVVAIITGFVLYVRKKTKEGFDELNEATSENNEENSGKE